jgi:enterochelin esterase family protein
MTTPLLHPDHTVTFRLHAPEADEVLIECEGFCDRRPMTRQADGDWSFTSPVLLPDRYHHAFFVDGVRTEPPAPFFEVPEAPDAPWLERDVPHGALHRHAYRSAIAAHDRECFVYTPPGFDPAKTYPVLYLLHGYSDGADAWQVLGKAHHTLDSLIADGAAEPMIVVMPLGYGDMTVLANGWEGRFLDGAWEKNLAAFDRTLLEEILPLAEANYPVRRDTAGRAIAGLSMGGTQAIQAALRHPDRFGWVGAFSSGGLPADLDAAFPAAAAIAASPFHLLWLACGRDDALLPANHRLTAWLRAKGIPHEWRETAGTHRWNLWRQNLADFARRLWR